MTLMVSHSNTVSHVHVYMRELHLIACTRVEYKERPWHHARKAQNNV